MRTSESIAKIASALVTCQQRIAPAAKDSVNPAFKSRYADLASVMDAARGPMEGAGLALSFSVSSTPDGHLVVTPLLMHASGEFIEFDGATFFTVQKTPQAQGSALTYARRSPNRPRWPSATRSGSKAWLVSCLV